MGNLEVILNLQGELDKGTPFSPYLFLICSKGLNGLIKKVVVGGKIKGSSLCKNGPQISHLFFCR